MGLSISIGRGATAAILVRRASLRRCLRPGYISQIVSFPSRTKKTSKKEAVDLKKNRAEQEEEAGYQYLATDLVEVGPHATLPILAEMVVGDLLYPRKKFRQHLCSAGPGKKKHTYLIVLDGHCCCRWSVLSLSLSVWRWWVDFLVMLRFVGRGGGGVVGGTVRAWAGGGLALMLPGRQRWDTGCHSQLRIDATGIVLAALRSGIHQTRE